MAPELPPTFATQLSGDQMQTAGPLKIITDKVCARSPVERSACRSRRDFFLGLNRLA